MVDFSDPENPYEYVPAEPADLPPTRPVKITIILIVCIVLGAIYLLGGLLGIPAALGLMNFKSNMKDPPPEVRMQITIQEKTQEIQKSYRPVLIFVTIVALVLGGFLIVCPVQVMQGDTFQKVMRLRLATLFTLFWVVFTTCFTALMQWQTLAAIDGALDEVADSTNVKFFKDIFWFAMILGIVFAVGFEVVKLVFFSYATLALKKYADNLTDSPPIDAEVTS